MVVVAFDHVVVGDLSTPCEIFGRARDAAGRPAYEVRVASVARRVRSHHVDLHVPHRLAALAEAQTIIVPGIDPLDAPLPAAVVRALRRAAERGARIASICSGAFVLAATGLLDGQRATTHWAAAGELARRHPRITVDPAVLYVDNGRILTSAGAAAGLDLCLHLVRRDLGAELAAGVARAAVMPLERAGGQAQFIEHAAPTEEDASLGPLLAWLDAHLDEDLSLARVAQQAHASERTLSRRFLEQVGCSPGAWIRRARVRRAQRLLETTELSVERVADEVGFGAAALLREHFHKVVGTSPAAYRHAFQQRTA